jgi:hypothetical protein
LVEDILLFVILEPGGVTVSTDSRPLVGANADALTDKVCREGGICNVKTQLPSKFFTDVSPADLQVDGIDILAFGKASLMPSSAPLATTRCLRAPIRGWITGNDVKAFMAAQRGMQEDASSAVAVTLPESGRMLQDTAAQSEFGLQVGLAGVNGDAADSSGSSSSAAIAAVAVLVVLAGCVGLFFFFRAKKNRKEEIAIENNTISTNSGQQSYSDSATPASVYGKFGQQANYRGKEPRFD